jgi:GNAT superfamily N-acetyltransferase
MLIRKLTIDDAVAFRQLRVDMCREHPEAFSQTPEEATAMSLEKFLEWMCPRDVIPQNFILGAFDGDRLIGSVGLRRENNAKEQHRGWIWAVYVRPEGRGKGVSRLLMQTMIDEARTWDGLEVLTLNVALTQTGARTLYTSLGFFTTGLILHGYKLSDGSYIDLEDMTLWL